MGTQGLCHLDHLPRGQALQGDRDLRENRPGPETEEERHWGPQQPGLERAAPRGCVQTAALSRPAPEHPTSSDTSVPFTARPFQNILSREPHEPESEQRGPALSTSGGPQRAGSCPHFCSWSPRLTLEAGPLTPRRRCSADPPDAKPGQAAGGERGRTEPAPSRKLPGPQTWPPRRPPRPTSPLSHLHCFGSVAGVETSTPQEITPRPAMVRQPLGVDDDLGAPWHLPGTHGAAFGTVVSGRALGSRGSSSTRRARLTLLSPFAFGSLRGKGGHRVPRASLAVVSSKKLAGGALLTGTGEEGSTCLWPGLGPCGCQRLPELRQPSAAPCGSLAPLGP